MPVWHAYEPGGDVQIWTGGDSRKVHLLRQAARFSVCVQQEAQPYKYVSVEGPVVAIDPIDLERELRPLVYRYLGPEAGAKYIEQLGSEPVADDVLIRMRPERWLGEDFGKTDVS